MIKIFFVVLLGAAGVLFKRVSYWIVGGLIIFISLLFTTCELIITDYYFLGLGTGLDTISFRLVVLSFLVCALMLFSRNSIFTGPKISLLYFYFFVYSLMLVLVLTFLVSNLLTFYFFFEASLVPTLLIIMGWGYQPERLQAGIYFLFYTLGASLPLLLCIVIAWYTCGTLDLTGYLEFSNLGGMEFVIFFFIVLAFIVKMPIFFSHLWLPKAHVEAPVSGSIILAGVLLKLGGYGLYRVFTLAKSGVSGYRGYYFGLRTLGILFVGLICCRLRDIKALVAYSSVAHMGIVICGLVSYYYWGFNGALAMIVAHGVCSSGMFCAVNIYYERSGRRGFYINKGLISFMPVFALIVFMLCAANIAAPPTINLLSEIFLIGRIMKYDYIILLAFPLGSYFGAVFTLFLFRYSQHGKYYEGGQVGSAINYREFHLMVLHLLPLNVLVLKPDFFLYIY